MSGRIAVLGADGYIGRRIVAALAASGWTRPLAVARRPGTAPGAERIVCDATDAGALREVLAGAQGAINCVAGSADTIVANARALGAAARSTNVPVVHLSSMAVYGSATGLVDESALLQGDTGAYADAKVRAERLLRDAPVTVLRPGIVYGAGSPQWSERIGRWLEARRLGDLGAAGDGVCNLVHVDDVAAAALAALRLPQARGRAFNLGSPDPPSWNDYFLAYARALGAVPLRRISLRRLQLERALALPLKALELAARAAGSRGTRLPAPMPPSLLATFAQDLRLDVRRAERELGLRWRALAPALAEAAAEHRAHG